MRVLLTGATGFIGSHVLTKLVEMKFPVGIIIRKSSDIWRIKDTINHTTVIDADLSDIDSLEQQILDFSPDIFIHLAWYGVENKYRNEFQQLSLNLSHTANLIEILSKTQVKKIIGFGSQAEYGPCDEPIDENVKNTPTTFYGVAKLCAHNMMELFCKQKAIDFAWMRIFSTYGPKDNNSWLIPTLVREILQQKSPALTEGKQLWDFLYVDDAADAIIAVMQANEAKGVFNLGSGRTVTIREAVERIRDHINPNIQLGFGAIPYRPDQVMFLQANVDKLKRVTGWTPKVSLDEGIQNTIAWYKNHENAKANS